MNKKTILFVTGTRAEWGLFRSTIFRLLKSPKINLKILATGMHTQRRFGLTLNEVKKDARVDAVVRVGEFDNQLEALSKEIAGIGRYLKRRKVDALLVIADRDEGFAAAVAGLHLGIPIIHVSGGDVSGPTVDQYLRNAITLFSKLHLVQTAKSKKNIIALGANPALVKVVGSAGLDRLNRNSLPKRKELSARFHLDIAKRWFLVVHHPTILDGAPIFKQINSVVSALRRLDFQDEKIVLYPNSDEGSGYFIKKIEALRKNPHFRVYRHIERADYLGLMKESAALIGNSSSGLMEGDYLKTPFVNVGRRQQNREAGSNVIFSDYDPDDILKGVRKAISPRFRLNLRRKPSVYRGGRVADGIAKAIEKFLKNL